MTRHETIARHMSKNKVDAISPQPHVWPDRAPMLSRAEQKIVGRKVSWLKNALEKSAQLGPDGYAALDCGTVRWGKHSLSWELRAYDQNMLYRDFDDQVGDEKTRLIFVLTAQEMHENLSQEQARLAALREVNLPVKIRPEHEGKRPLRSKKQSAAQSRTSAQG